MTLQVHGEKVASVMLDFNLSFFCRKWANLSLCRILDISLSVSMKDPEQFIDPVCFVLDRFGRE